MTPLLSNDLSNAAAEFISLIQLRRPALACSKLDDLRKILSVDLCEALDRKIAYRVFGREFLAFWPPAPFDIGYLAHESLVRTTVTRINSAWTMPPPMPSTTGLGQRDLYDIYSSIVETRGNRAAIEAMENRQRIILGLRQETSTFTNRGQGVYDDRIVVLAKGDNAAPPTVEEFLRASTEPTAQYDGNQRNNKNVKFRRAEGANVSGDKEPELGRLAAGTIEMLETTHQNPGSAKTNFSLRPTRAAITGGANGVQRDTNHDGLFNALDVNGAAPLNSTFKIHSGSRTNTDSAGCQTIHPDDYARFRRAAKADTAQTTWYYVLTHTGQRMYTEWRIPMRSDAWRPR